MHATSPSDHTDQRPSIEPELLEPKANGVDRVGAIDRMMRALIGLDEGQEHVEAISPGRSFGSAL